MASPFSGTPVADDATISTTVDTPVDFQLTGNCAGTMHFSIVTAPTEGTFGSFDEDTGEVEYIPGPDFEGTDVFTFTVDDGSDVSNEATVTLEVLAATTAGTPSTPPSSAPPAPAPPSTIPPPPPAPTGTGLAGMGPAAIGAAVGAAAATAAGTAGGATPPPMPPAPAPGTPATPWWTPVTPAAPPGPVPPTPTTGGATPPAPAGGVLIVPPPPPPPAPAPAPATTTPWYRDWRRVVALLALLALLAFLLWLVFGGGNCGGGAPGPVPPTPPAPPTATTTTTPPPPPPVVTSGVSCPAGYTKVPLASNSCQLLGWDGEEMPYEAVSSPQAGRLVVGNNPLPHKNVVTGFTPIAGEDLAICWPSAIPFGSEVAANSVMWAIYGQHANRVTQPGWYSTSCDWQSRCGLRLKDPSCVRYNTDGTADFTMCNMVIPVPIP